MGLEATVMIDGVTEDPGGTLVPSALARFHLKAQPAGNPQQRRGLSRSISRPKPGLCAGKRGPRCKLATSQGQLPGTSR